jgi:hypothetical protein
MPKTPRLRTLDVADGPWWWAELCPTCADHFARFYDEAEPGPDDDEDDEEDQDDVPF